MALSDMVYQGDALGPPLWNIFFEHAASDIRFHDFYEIVFAKDFNAYKAYKSDTGNQVMFSELNDCELHSWWKSNQVSFGAKQNQCTYLD